MTTSPLNTTTLRLRDRIDLYAFISAVAVGVVGYVVMLLLETPQVVMTATLVAVMLLYTLVVLRVPSMRVRLDQAADNAYYIGLLFTLTSMAAALYGFSIDADEKIISHFGIALATTIVGIFLRVTLHQMRIDPSAIEAVTRLELAEASKRVRARLDEVERDLVGFHDETRQRTADFVAGMCEEASKSVEELGGQVGRSLVEVAEVAGEAQRRVLAEAEQLVDGVRTVAEETRRAAERLQRIEPAPVAVVQRMEEVSHALAGLGAQIEVVRLELHRASDGAAGTAVAIDAASEVFRSMAEKCDAQEAMMFGRMEVSAERLDGALEQIGERLKEDSGLLRGVAQDSRNTAEELMIAQKAAGEVLRGLSGMVQTLLAEVKDIRSSNEQHPR